MSSGNEHISSARTKLQSNNGIRRNQGRKLIYKILLKMGNPKGEAVGHRSFTLSLHS